MDAGLVLCSHLASSDPASLAPARDDILEAYDGPVDAVVRCSVCESAALIVMLDWSRTTDLRIYAMAALDPSAFALFQRNRARGSCDASRLASELHALWASAGPAERLLAVDVRTGRVVAKARHPGGAGLPIEAWTERLPAAEDQRWFELVGLSKSESRAE